MMTDEEIAYIDKLLEELRPESCLEWGSGGSTIYFPKKHDFIKVWFSIEHTKKWFNYVSGRMGDLNIVLQLRRVEDYVKTYGKWSFVLIDGIKRNECLAQARGLLKRGGIILLHDSHRRDYDEGIALYGDKKEVICEGTGEGENSHQGLTKLW